MRECFITTLLIVAGAAAEAQTPDARTPVAREWKVTVVETVPLAPVQITDPTLRLVEDTVTGESRVELTFVATNLTDNAVSTNLSVWIHEFGPDGSWFFDDLALTTPPSRLGPGQRLRIRSPYREGFDRREGTWLMFSLKFAWAGESKWEQSDPWKKAVAVWRGQASPGLDDLSYDEFMDLEPDGRRAVFNYVSAGAKARLMRTQLERFLAGRGATLTREQRILVEEAIATTSADLYAPSRWPEAEARARDLGSRARLLFTTAELQQLLTLDGPKITFVPQ